jgi:hypothetical protein
MTLQPLISGSTIGLEGQVILVVAYGLHFTLKLYVHFSDTFQTYATVNGL